MLLEAQRTELVRLHAELPRHDLHGAATALFAGIRAGAQSAGGIGAPPSPPARRPPMVAIHNPGDAVLTPDRHPASTLRERSRERSRRRFQPSACSCTEPATRSWFGPDQQIICRALGQRGRWYAHPATADLLGPATGRAAIGWMDTNRPSQIIALGA